MNTGLLRASEDFSEHRTHKASEIQEHHQHQKSWIVMYLLDCYRLPAWVIVQREWGNLERRQLSEALKYLRDESARACSSVWVPKMCLLRVGHQDLTCSSLVTNFSPTLGGISKQRAAEWYGDPGSMPLVPSSLGHLQDRSLALPRCCWGLFWKKELSSSEIKSLQANYAKLVKLLLLSVTFFLSCSLSLKNKKNSTLPLYLEIFM